MKCETFPITVQHVTVYHSGRRRFLTLDAACRDAARRKVFARVYANGEDVNETVEWWRPRVDRLARLYKRIATLHQPKDTPHD